MPAVPVLHANQKPCVTRVGSIGLPWQARSHGQQPSGVVNIRASEKTAGGKLLIVACKVHAEHEAMHVVRSIEPGI